MSESLPATVDFDRLLKLRLVVARVGEMDLQAWWNTKGVLGRLGRSVYQRGFPRTAPFAQARVVFAVARSRTRELWNPSACATLWNLPPEIEDGFEDQWQRWLDEADAWLPIFASLQDLSGDLLHGLRALEVFGELDAARARDFKRSLDGRAVLLPGVRRIDDATLADLAAGFFRGDKGSPAIPYARLEA